MGQRLNIELHFPDQLVVNCYYHRSWYTESALDLIQKIVNANKTLTDTDHIIRWVRLFEATWASLTKEELDYAVANLDKTIHNQLEVWDIIHRNNWLIAISPEWIEETLYCKDHMTKIRLDKDNNILSINILDLFSVDLDRFYEESDKPEWNKDLFTKEFDFISIKPEQLNHIISVIQKFDYKKTFTVEWDLSQYRIIA